jgi:hypothetical protein
MRARILAAGLASLLMATAAQSAIVVKTFDITASNFTYSFGDNSVAPVPSVHLNFTVNFDNTANIFGTVAGLTVNSFNLPYAINYAYNSSVDLLVIASDSYPSGCSNPASSFCGAIDGVSGATPNLFFFQQSTSTGGYYVAQTKALTVGNAVPEPASWAMLLIGFGGIGTALRTRQRRLAAA